LLRYIPDKWENNKEEFFKKALKETINLGGDTDTNACIVGGMVGALVGLKSIP
jgi:ADP-ribosylglycohydrolase